MVKGQLTRNRAISFSYCFPTSFQIGQSWTSVDFTAVKLRLLSKRDGQNWPSLGEFFGNQYQMAVSNERLGLKPAPGLRFHTPASPFRLSSTAFSVLGLLVCRQVGRSRFTNRAFSATANIEPVILSTKSRHPFSRPRAVGMYMATAFVSTASVWILQTEGCHVNTSTLLHCWQELVCT